MLKSTKKWDHDDIAALIHAYKSEPCLYSLKSPNYSNKTLRAHAIERVAATVKRDTGHRFSAKECMAKLHGMRTQFNVENNKRRRSLQSGADEVYVPSLWYFPLLKFVEENVQPRKSKKHSPAKNSSKTNNITLCDLKGDQEYEVEVTDYSNDSYSHHDQTASLSSGSNLLLPASSPPPIVSLDPLLSIRRGVQPSPPPLNNDSRNGEPNVKRARPALKTEMRIEYPSEDDHHHIQEASPQPVNPPQQPSLRSASSSTVDGSLKRLVPDSVDTSMAFITCILREMKHKRNQSELIAQLVQSALTAKAKDEAEYESES